MTGNSFIQRQLVLIERVGNRLPHPTLLFLYLCGIIALCSSIFWAMEATATHPVNGQQIAAKSLLTGEGIRYILTSAVSNFTGFAPVGTVLVA
ncbi:MAG: AbgT family transporter, partial [Pseudomonadales bacterium]